MGCIPSSPRVTSRRDNLRNRPRKTEIQQPPSSPVMMDPTQIKHNTKKIFLAAVTGIRQIASPVDVSPQVCVGENTFPIVTSLFKIDIPESSSVCLPVVTCALAGSGIIICISSLDFLTQTYFTSFDTAQFFSQLAHVISGSQRTFAHTYCIGFERAEAKAIKPSFDSMSLYAEFVEVLPTLQQKSVVVLNTRCNLSPDDMQNLRTFVEVNGGGIIVFFNPNEDSQNINEFLMQFGVIYTNLILSNPTDAIDVNQNFEVVGANTFTEVSKKFVQMIKSSVIDAEELEKLVTSLRIYVLACGDENTEQLISLLECCWDYLHKTNYIEDGKFFKTKQQSIVATLVLDLLQKFPLELLSPIEGYEIFPGVTGESVELADFDIEIQLSCQEWTSTGLWIPAGVTADVIIENPPPSTFIQIGCHNEKSQ